MTSSRRASAASCVSFSFETSLSSCCLVTSRDFSSAASTNFCSTSLTTTGMSAAAIAWAISPPIVPPPTTAALKTSMAGQAICRADSAACSAADVEGPDGGSRVLDTVGDRPHLEQVRVAGLQAAEPLRRAAIAPAAGVEALEGRAGDRGAEGEEGPAGADLVPGVGGEDRVGRVARGRLRIRRYGVLAADPVIQSLGGVAEVGAEHHVRHHVVAEAVDRVQVPA